MAQITMMIGAMTEKGILNIAANKGTQVSTTINPAMLPRYMLAMRPQTKSFCSTNSSGPGCRPQISKPPSSTAAVGEPGTRSEEHTSELQSHHDLVCRLLLEKKKQKSTILNSNHRNR